MQGPCPMLYWMSSISRTNVAVAMIVSARSSSNNVNPAPLGEQIAYVSTTEAADDSATVSLALDETGEAEVGEVRSGGLAERSCGAYRLDDVVNGLAGFGGVGLVADHGVVGGGVGDPVETVGRQRGHVVLLLFPSSVVPGVGGEDDQRLPVEVGQGCGLLHRGVGFDELFDVATEVARQRRVGACLALNARRKSVVGGLGEQPSGSEVSDRRHEGGDATEDVVGGAGRQGRARLGCGGVEEHQA